MLDPCDPCLFGVTVRGPSLPIPLSPCLTPPLSLHAALSYLHSSIFHCLSRLESICLTLVVPLDALLSLLFALVSLLPLLVSMIFFFCLTQG
jgi:hypothetical protein